MTQEEYAKMLAASKDQFKSSKPLFGKDGAFHQVLEDFLNAALEGEMDSHLEATKPESGNRRNGKMRKQLQTEYGPVEIETLRDRDGSFDPETVRSVRPSWPRGFQTRLSVFTSVARACSRSATSSGRTMAAGFQRRPSATSPIRCGMRSRPGATVPLMRYILSSGWMPSIIKYATTRGLPSESRAIYNVIGIAKSGHKDLLGMYVSHSEGANFWLGVLTDLQNRGVKDILIACVDGLSGFPDAIQCVFPNTDVQLCIVHQIRNSVKYVGSKNQKEFLKDLKLVYAADTKEKAETELDHLEEKWGRALPHCHQIKEREMGYAELLFSVHRSHPQNDLYDQYC